MKLLLIITLILLLFSLIFDRKKTFSALKIAWNLFINILPSFLTILILVTILLTLLPKEVLAGILGEKSGVFGFVVAAVLGSISLIPGFVAYPLSSVLLKNGASYPVIGVFITTLMMVGIVTLPLEKKFFGLKTALIRNVLSFIAAILIGLAIAFIWRIL
ncbi:MAG TPA: permease [Spirochaetota bacterium]|nr:permease [Spirochaetota bacterium]HPQ49963.1 permease [Spirochaetota bacterium]